jgi:LuxR family transcriptional regulator, maltose regulon positive regulatory protein
MARTLQREDRYEPGVFAPMERPRLVERLHASATHPIALLIAPAGYGKSVALQQYLASLHEPNVRFTLRSDHATLLGFLRGFAEALRERAPHAITALAGAYERSTASPKRGIELARWMHAHLESVSGVVAIDDLHVANGDPEVAGFLNSLIEHTKGRIRWILASRSSAGLPVGTWLAYGDAELPLDEHELRFTLEEARNAADGLTLQIGDDELQELLALTEGWPAAMSFALRTSIRSSELRSVSAMTREMIYRLLAEQVYATLDDDERSLLEVAIALPSIEVSVLERAGFDRALPIVERLRERTSFVFEESAGVYQCHDLFGEFLRHQSALGGKRYNQTVHERAARALEASGDVEHAITSYVSAAVSPDVVRLLERHGFDLLERARGDVVARAIESLDEPTRRQNAAVLALQGALQAIAGKFARAESLFQRALARATERDLVAIVSLRLASLMANEGRAIQAVLYPVTSDNSQNIIYRAEALSLIAAGRAVAGDMSYAGPSAIAEVERLLSEVEGDATRVKVLHHLGIVSRHTGDTNGALERLMQSSDLASELHFYNFASRGYAVLSNLALREEDDVDQQLRFASLAAEAASKAGDAFALQTALLQTLSAHMRMGNVEESLAIDRQLASVQTNSVSKRYLKLFRSLRLAWDGHFADAHRLLDSVSKEMPPGPDPISCRAHHALFLALDGRSKASAVSIKAAVEALPAVKPSGLFDARLLTLSQVLCALAEGFNGRPTVGDRILRRVRGDDTVERLATRAARSILGLLAGTEADRYREATGAIETLGAATYGDVARLFEALCREIIARNDAAVHWSKLTPSELRILRFISDGRTPKEIAEETVRSVNTVRAHLARAIQKLDCHGRSEAVKVARRRGLI